MPGRFTSIALALPVAGPVGVLLNAQAPVIVPAAAVSFATDVDPILERDCRSCHGDAVRMGKLDLTTRDGALRGGTRGSDIVPGNAEASRLYSRISGLELPAMPAQGTPLTATEIAAVKQWIDEGAKWDAEPGIEREAGGRRRTGRAGEPHHHAGGAKLLGVQAAGPGAASAGRRRAIHQSDRSVSRAGPARPRADAGAASRSPHPRPPRLSRCARPAADAGASRRVRQRSIARRRGSTSSTACSRRRTTASATAASGWTSRAMRTRPASSTTRIEPNAWRYRDYVIKSFNDDKPYDRFLIEQIAGDEMDGRTDDSLIATGFLRMGPARPVSREGQSGAALRLPRRDHRHDWQGHAGVDGQLRPVPQPQIRSDFAEGLLQARSVALRLCRNRGAAGPKAEAEAYLAKNEEIDARIAELKRQIEGLERPYRDRLQRELIKQKFPETCGAGARQARERAYAWRCPPRHPGA